MPAGFQYSELGSSAIATNAPPIERARAPCPIERNGAAVVPFLETFDLKVCDSAMDENTIITAMNDTVVLVFIFIVVIFPI